MFVVRPVFYHFILWFVLAPLFLLELHALDQFLKTSALLESTNPRIVSAEVTSIRTTTRGPEVRYRFQVPGDSRWYSAANTGGWGEPWIPISENSWLQANAHGRTLQVMYLPDDPSANQPVGRIGSPLSESFLGWSVFLMLDLLWFAETFVILRNYVRCQIAVERRQPARMRFWESRAA